jgi:hypothetical protein
LSGVIEAASLAADLVSRAPASPGSTSPRKSPTTASKLPGARRALEASWQVTGIRKDPWAERNRIAV